MIVDRARNPDATMIPGRSGSLQMVDHTLIDVPFSNVYLDSPYYKGYCKEYVSDPLVHARCSQTRTESLKTREELGLGPA